MTDVCFLVPAYNPDRAAMDDTLRSIATQGFACRTLIVDDGSREPVTVADRPGVEVLRVEPNGGITNALRAGVEHILADPDIRYVARLDIGDFNRPQRIERQRAFMEEHPDVDLLGGRSNVTDMTGQSLFRYGVSDPAALARSIYRATPFTHSTFFIRCDALRRIGNYDPDFVMAQDYELALRYHRFGALRCIEDIVIDYVRDPGGLSLQRRKTSLRMRMKAQWKHRQPLNPHWVMGMVRSMLLYLMPADLATWLAKQAYS